MKEDKSSLIVVVIDSEAEILHTALGITEERGKYLGSKLKRMYAAYDTLHEVAHEMSKHCTHANELFWVAMQLGANVSDNRGSGLEQLLRRLKD